MDKLLQAIDRLPDSGYLKSGKPSCFALGRAVGRRIGAAERDRVWKVYLNREAAHQTPPPPPKRPRGDLMRGITEANGYRPQFVRFMERHLIEPRSNAFDRVYEWARSHECNRRGMPGCGCQQRLLHSLDMPGAWKNSLKDLARRLNKPLDSRWYEPATYGGDPAPARKADERKPPPPKPVQLPPPVRTGSRLTAEQLRSKVLGARRKISRAELNAAIQASGLRYLRREWLMPATYYALPLDLWSELLEWSDIDSAEYVLGERDCKTFSMALAGQMKLRFRVTCPWVFDTEAGHAYNAIVLSGDFDGDGDTEIRVVAVEPQTDRLPQIGSGSHKAGSGKIVIL